jgi:hypothetical protein
VHDQTPGSVFRLGNPTAPCADTLVLPESRRLNIFMEIVDLK